MKKTFMAAAVTALLTLTSCGFVPAMAEEAATCDQTLAKVLEDGKALPGANISPTFKDAQYKAVKAGLAEVSNIEGAPENDGITLVASEAEGKVVVVLSKGECAVAMAAFPYEVIKAILMQAFKDAENGPKL